jgi:prepilin-type N-terminal cleavage/methylation domain-containing protein
MRSLFARAGRRLRGAARDDSGFSLIEAVVALAIASVAFTALAASGMVAIKASLTGRANQQSADFLTRKLEEIRLLDYASVANVTSDLAGDSAIDTCSGKPCVDPGTGTKEQIYVGTGTGGAVNPHIETITNANSAGASNHTTYTLKTYVTMPADTYTTKYHRVTVVATWHLLGQDHVRRLSTMIAYSQKGLPLPVFSLATKTATTVSVNPGADVTYGFKLVNQGAPDRFNLAEDDAFDWTWVYDNGDGVFTEADDTTPVVDTNSDGIIDTGRMNPNDYRVFWVFRDIASTAPASSTLTHWSGTSVGQPTATTAVQTAVTTTNVVIGVITPSPSTTAPPSPAPVTDCNTVTAPSPAANSGYSLQSRSLHNASTPGNTTAQGVLAMDTSAPLASTLYEYSTDVAAAEPGRVLTTGGTSTTGNASQVATWRYVVGSKKRLSGTAQVTIWASGLSGSPAANLNLEAYIYTYKTSTGVQTLLATIPLTAIPNSCTGFQKLVATGGVSQTSNSALTTTDQVGLKVVNKGTGSVRIAYDVTGAYPATLVLPQK